MGIVVTLAGASLRGWGVHTWWGVIGEQRGPTPAHVPFMVSIVPAIVLVLVATLSRESSDRRMWFGPAVAVTAMMWLLQVVAWILLYADLTAIEVPAGGSWLMLAGLALTIAGGLGYARSCHRRQPIEVASRLRGTPATWALVGAGVAVVGATLPIWGRDNPWGTPLPPIPVGVNPRSDWGAVNWWGVLGPDPGDEVGALTELTIVGAPAVVLALVLLVPLTVKGQRRWFGPAVAAAAAMWIVWVIAWWGIYEDHVDSVTIDAGSLLMVVGLFFAAAAALSDAADELP